MGLFNKNFPNRRMAPKKDPKAAAGKGGAKAAPAKAPPKKKEGGGGGGGKAKKKKWSKGKTRDKLNNLVLFDKATYDKLLKEVPTYKLITPSIVSERLKVRGSLAKRGMGELHEKGLIKLVLSHHAQMVYTRCAKEEGAEVTEVVEKAPAAAKEPKQKKVKAKKGDKAEEEMAE